MDHQAEASFDGAPQSIARARSFVGSILASWDLEDLSDVAILLVSELASNAVEHAQSDFGIRVGLDPPHLLVEVHDRSTQPPILHIPRPADSRRRGIMIVEALAARWGYRPTEEGKVVWFRLDFQASGPSDTGETEKPSGSSEDE